MATRVGIGVAGRYHRRKGGVATPMSDGGDRARGQTNHPGRADGGIDALCVRNARSSRRVAGFGHHASVGDHGDHSPVGQRASRLVRSERIDDVRHLCGGGRRRRPSRIHHRIERRRVDVVGRDSPGGRHLAVRYLMPLGVDLLRRRGLGDHEVEGRWIQLDRSGLSIPHSVDLLLCNDSLRRCRGIDHCAND